MVIGSRELQDPAYRATLLLIRWAWVKTALTFPVLKCSVLPEAIPKLSDLLVRDLGQRKTINISLAKSQALQMRNNEKVISQLQQSQPLNA
jgi:hypothetical protein